MATEKRPCPHCGTEIAKHEVIEVLNFRGDRLCPNCRERISQLVPTDGTGNWSWAKPVELSRESSG